MILKHKLIAVKNPSNGETIVRRMMARESEWVIRADNGTFRQVPRNHIWVECENNPKK